MSHFNQNGYYNPVNLLNASGGKCFAVHITLIVEKMETLLKNKIVNKYFIGKGRAQAEAKARVLVSKEVYSKALILIIF